MEKHFLSPRAERQRKKRLFSKGIRKNIRKPRVYAFFALKAGFSVITKKACMRQRLIQGIENRKTSQSCICSMQKGMPNATAF